MVNGARAGLVGTNTIRQNYSRIGGLDYIVDNGGVIYDAVSSMPWSGEANVNVSIANWSKSKAPVSTSKLHFFVKGNEYGEYVFRTVNVNKINSALSEKTDVRSASTLAVNIRPKRVFQGVIPGNDGFLLDASIAYDNVKHDRRNLKVLKPYLIGEDLLGQSESQPTRYVIDFGVYDVIGIRGFPSLYKIVVENVLPDRERNAKEEIQNNAEALLLDPYSKTSEYHQRLLRSWWKHTARRVAMNKCLENIDRYIGCSRVTKRPIFEFVSNGICPADLIQVFAFDDDYTFGILQSHLHWLWFNEKMSTLRDDPRYTPTFVFNTFPFPQDPSSSQIKSVAAAGRDLHEYRRREMAKSESRLNLRDMYRSLEEPGDNPLRDLHETLDQAVLAVYGFDPADDILEQLLALNFEVAAKIEAGESVTAPGIPPDYPNPAELISDGCIQPPDLF